MTDIDHATGSATRASTPRRRAKRLAGLVAGVLAALGIAAVATAGPGGDTAALNWLQDERTGEVGRGAQTVLHRSDDEVTAQIHARRLHRGHAYTAWFVIFNEPDGCVDGCGEDDLFRPEAATSVVWSGASGIANPAGNLNVTGRIGTGDPDAQGVQVLFGPGLTDAQSTEIHIVVHDHGPVSADRATREAQLSTFEGNCTPASSFDMGSGPFDCVDPQASVHVAATG